MYTTVLLVLSLELFENVEEDADKSTVSPEISSRIHSLVDMVSSSDGVVDETRALLQSTP